MKRAVFASVLCVVGIVLVHGWAEASGSIGAGAGKVSPRAAYSQGKALAFDTLVCNGCPVQRLDSGRAETLQDGQDGGHPEEVAPDGSQDETASPGGGTADPSDTAPESTAASTGHIGRDAAFSYDLLDPTTNINRKQRLILHRKQDGTLPPDSVLVQGALAAVANAQLTNRPNKFGYLMRHPTAANQVGSTVSEAALHSVQLGLAATPADWITTNVEILYDPQQSFGAGINTVLERNQLQVRRAYALFGDLDRSPLFVSLGKMAVPFGLTDTVNPFTASTVWHAFGGLANGVRLGYSSGGVNLSVMGIQGGAQFRAANTSVKGTAVPSRLNNFSVDASYSRDVRSDASVLVGASYQKGTAFCQEFPVVHFGPCAENNPAFDAYGRLVYRKLTLKGEFAQTTREWPGTFNPDIPQFAASRVTSFDIGTRYRHEIADDWIDFSAEFSQFEAGPDGAPWERQEQLVLGVAWFVRRSAKLFFEYVRIAGYSPLNFISGGNIRNEMGELLLNRTQSDRSARSHVVLLGAGVAF